MPNEDNTPLLIGSIKKLYTHFSRRNERTKKLHFLVSFILLFGITMIMTLGWFFVDRNQNYRVGHPSPRTYLALSSMRFEDPSATEELRQRAAERIASVRTTNEDITRAVHEKIEALGDVTQSEASIAPAFLPAPLRTLLQNLPEDERLKILTLSHTIATELESKTASFEEQSSLIWQRLRVSGLEQASQNIAFQVVDTTLTPALEPAPDMTDWLKKEVRRQIPAVERKYSLGDTIIQKGAMVTPQIAQSLLSQGYLDATYPWKQLIFVLLSCFFWCTWLIWAEFTEGKKDVISSQEGIYISLVLVLYWGVQRMFAININDSMAILAVAGWFYMTLPPIVAFHSVLGGGLLGFMIAFNGMYSYIVMGMIISLVAAGTGYFTCRDVENRLSIWRNLFCLGFCLSSVTIFLRWGMGLSLSWMLFGRSLLFCVFWSSLVIALLPLWETFFGILSPLRLIELSHPSQPLLKRLQLEAPGTYYHMIMVGTLAEAAADRLQMNGLLVKAGAYYHDIGKLKRPLFFVENQQSGENIHDTMAPLLSALVIISHVPDGVDIAERYKLPKILHSFILEHHGTTSLSYFYRKALEQGEELSEDAFKYPGPRPQSRETALVMLADSVEAAIKAMKSRHMDAKELAQLVEDVVSSKIISGQLDDVDFTMADLAQIKVSFADTLRSMQHSRQVRAVPSLEQLRRSVE